MDTYFQCGACETRIDIPEPEDLQKFMVKKDQVWGHYKWEHFGLIATENPHTCAIDFHPIPADQAPTLVDGDNTCDWAEVQHWWG